MKECTNSLGDRFHVIALVLASRFATGILAAALSEVLDGGIFTASQQLRPETLAWTDVNRCLIVSSKDVTSAQHP